MASLLDLAKSLELKAASLETSASEIAVKGALTIIGELVYRTPVDSSQALSNFLVYLDNPQQERIPANFPGQQGSTQKASAQETIAKAKKVLANKKPGQTIFIINALPYIQRLNDGYSSQAPAGFAEASVLIGRRFIRNQKLELK